MRIQQSDTSKNEYNEGNVVLLTNWILKINIKKFYFKIEKLY